MVTKEQRERNRIAAVHRIRLVWEALVERARQRGIVRYRDLGNVTDVHGNELYKTLDAIYYYCKCKGIPPLPVLAVSPTAEYRDEPGAGYLGIDIQRETGEVWEYDWSSVSPPEYDDL